MYTRRWGHLKWFDRFKMHNQLRIRPPPDNFHIFQKFQPLVDTWGSIPKKLMEQSEDTVLVQELLKKYPDLRYTNTAYASLNIANSTEGNYLFDFVSHQKRLIRKGYTKEKAFELTEKKFHDRFSNKIEAVQVATRLAINNNARSLLNLTQQQAEFEATLKVKRITRDLSLFEEGQKEMNKTLLDLENEEARSHYKGRDQDLSDIEEEFSEFSQAADASSAIGEQTLEPTDDYLKKYTRVLHKIVPEGKENPEERLTKDKRTDIIETFINNSKNMFNLYYQRAATKDKLAGLTDKEIMDAVANSPKRIKRDSSKLLKKLEKYNIKLDARGEVDFSDCPHPNVVKQLKENPLVKVVLMQADLEFESPHREIQVEAARRAKAEFEESKKSREREELLQEEARNKAREADRASASDASPFHQQYNIRYPQADMVVEREVKETAKERADKFAKESSEGLSAEATYRVFETYEERMARLEKKWLKSRLAALQGGVEKPTEDEKKVLLDKAVNKLRRLKYLVDQKNLKNAKDLMFEEHRVFTKEELMVDEEVTVEKLADYLKLPDERRRLQAIDEIDDNKILNMIKRKEIVEDTARPYTDNYAYKLAEEDTFEIRMEKINKERMRVLGVAQARKGEREEAGGEEEEDPMEAEAEGEGEETGSERAHGAKVEKKRLIDYIKESTAKKGAPPAKGGAEGGKKK